MLIGDVEFVKLDTAKFEAEREAEKLEAERKAKESSPGASQRSAGVVLPLPQYVVNLTGGKHTLKLSMDVEANADIEKEMQASGERIRDAMVTLLSSKSFAEIQSPEGKVLLRAEVAARLNQILGSLKITRVYFKEFFVE